MLQIGLSFAKIRQRLEQTHSQEIITLKKLHTQETSSLHAHIHRLESTVSPTAREFAQIQAENEMLQAKLLAEFPDTRAQEVIELIRTIRQRNKSDQELWNLKHVIHGNEQPTISHGAPPPTKRKRKHATTTRYISKQNFDIYQSSKLDATIANELIYTKNKEIDTLQDRLHQADTRLRDDEFFDPDGEPKWKRFQKLYHQALVCDCGGEPILDSMGNPQFQFHKLVTENNALKAQVSAMSHQLVKATSHTASASSHPDSPRPHTDTPLSMAPTT
jgi:hypothetical protein